MPPGRTHVHVCLAEVRVRLSKLIGSRVLEFALRLPLPRAPFVPPSSLFPAIFPAQPTGPGGPKTPIPCSCSQKIAGSQGSVLAPGRARAAGWHCRWPLSQLSNRVGRRLLARTSAAAHSAKGGCAARKGQHCQPTSRSYSSETDHDPPRFRRLNLRHFSKTKCFAFYF